MRAVIAPERALAIQKLAATFKSARPLKAFQRMLGLMAAASPVLQLGLLRMRPLQRCLKPRVPHNAWRHGRLHIRVNQACVTALTPWKNPRWMKKGVAMGLVHSRKVVMTDASNTGWGGAVRRQTDFRPLVEGGEGLPDQLLGNASSLSSLPVFPARPNRTPCADSLRQHVRGVLYKSPLSGERNNMVPSTRAVGSPPLAARREPTGLPERVLNTISEARAPSTRRLYALKWSVFSTWCLNRGENPSTSELAVVLSFLQELLDKGRSHSTLRVFVAAIAAFHAPIAVQSVGRDNSVVRFLKGDKRLNPPRPLTVPTWDLPTVLRALKGLPFEPLQSTNLRSLSLKTALLLALASVKRVGDLQALSISPACLEFGPNDSKVVLKPRHGYIPKVLSTPFRAQVITLCASSIWGGPGVILVMPCQSSENLLWALRPL